MIVLILIAAAAKTADMPTAPAPNTTMAESSGLVGLRTVKESYGQGPQTQPGGIETKLTVQDRSRASLHTTA